MITLNVCKKISQENILIACIISFFMLLIPTTIIAQDDVKNLDSLAEIAINNGNFADGLSHWFSSSDSHHMPWHMKSMFFNTLFDQGLIGLAVLALMIFVAMFRLTAGGARSHPLTPVIAGSLSGFLVVGAFDSLIDVPRLAALFYFVLMVSLLIRMPASNRQSRQV